MQFVGDDGVVALSLKGTDDMFEMAIDSIGKFAAFIERDPRKVAKESMVSFKPSCYSVPPEYVGRDVTVELGGQNGAVIVIDAAPADGHVPKEFSFSAMISAVRVCRCSPATIPLNRR
ncbi:MAG TPA: hypothetical protein PLD59_00265 [Tepidisphaeraceae bacterium]|nr:hypothetical protein [Tepidisphaeraceae bacterium]